MVSDARKIAFQNVGPLNFWEPCSAEDQYEHSQYGRVRIRRDSKTDSFMVNLPTQVNSLTSQLVHSDDRRKLRCVSTWCASKTCC